MLAAVWAVLGIGMLASAAMVATRSQRVGRAVTATTAPLFHEVHRALRAANGSLSEVA